MNPLEKNLAINGGPKTKITEYGTGKRFDEKELNYLREALEQNTLFYGFGNMVKKACTAMQAYTSMPYIVACSSGSAAVHLGLIAAGIGPGDEVIVTPNTDSGSVLGIIEEGAVPIFCDPDFNLQPTVESIAACITPRTRAVVLVHLAGFPAPADAIARLCRARKIGLVEDCAQSWGTRLNGQLVGTFGDAGCFSTNDFKHISTGDGGFVALRDEALYRRVSNYSDKHYDRLFDRTQLQAHHGINYRMSELQGAVALAQLEKVDQITCRHNQLGELFTKECRGIPGATLVTPIPGGYSTYWWTAAFLDLDAFSVGRDKIVEAIQAEGLGSIGNYNKYDLIQKKLFQERIVRPWLESPRNMYPFVQPDGRSYTYGYETTPRHEKMLKTGLFIGMNCFYTETDMREMAAGLKKVLKAYYRDSYKIQH